MNNIKAIKRDKSSTGSNNKLRREGYIPAILYGGKNPNQKISVEKNSIKNILNSDSFLSKVLDMSIDGKNEKVLPREVAFNVVSEEPIHIDFLRIVAGKNNLEIPVKFKNHSESPGLKKGVFKILLTKSRVKISTDNIPDEIVVDLAGTDIQIAKITSVKLAIM